MRRVVYLVCIVVVFLIGACNTTNVEESHGKSDILYTYNQELKQNFEGVKLVMTYRLRDAESTVQVEVTGTLTNDFSNRIYYTPAFIMEDGNGTQYAAQDVREISLAPQEEIAFSGTIELPAEVYETSEVIHFFVPAAFTQSGSTSSGDALGDTVWWELPLK